MKMRMIMTALVVCGALVCVQAAAVAGPIVDKYLVGDKDDFDNGDGDGIFNLVTGDVVGLPWATMNSPEAGNTDATMMSDGSDGVFDFTFNVAARAEPLVSGLLRTTTWDVNWNSPTAWALQPITVKVGAVEVVLPTTLSYLAGGSKVQVDEIPLSAAALALIAGGGEVHVIIGTPATLTGNDAAILDYGELELTFESGGGDDAIPEASTAALMVTGLAGLVTRRRRRS